MGVGGKSITRALVGLLLALGLCSCTPIREFDFHSHNPRPKPRVGRNASATVLTNFTGDDVGSHSYNIGVTEKNGIIYTCRAGHLDLAHVRKAMDWTAYLAAKTYKMLVQKQTEFSFMVNEPARYHVELTYPADWDYLPGHERRAIAHEVAIDLGAYLAYMAATLHEIFTWYDFNVTIVFSEFSSAFSWEDNISNLLGSLLGKQVLRQRGDYNECATRILNEELIRLQIQPLAVAKKASKQMEGQWYEGRLFLKDLLQRHFDIGSDGLVESCTVDIPECCGCEAEAFAAPDLEGVLTQGFLAKIEIKPFLVKDKILSAAYPDEDKRKDTITPDRFACIMQSIAKEAEAMGYAFVQ